MRADISGIFPFIAVYICGGARASSSKYLNYLNHRAIIFDQGKRRFDEQ